MQTIELNMYQAIAVAVLMLLLGRMMVSKIEFLRRYCIPAPVVGGLVFAIIHMILRSAGVLEFQLDTTLQSVFMTAFFCSVGYMAAFKELKKGGVGVIKFLIVSIVMCCIQDLVGGFGAKIFGLDPRLGLTMGSIPLVGGHGTAGSFGPFLEDLGVANRVGKECGGVAHLAWKVFHDYFLGVQRKGIGTRSRAVRVDDCISLHPRLCILQPFSTVVQEVGICARHHQCQDNRSQYFRK